MLELLVLVMFESGNHPTPSMRESSLTMPNFSPSKYKFKKSQRWPRVRIINPPLSKFGHMSKLGVMSKSGVHLVYL